MTLLEVVPEHEWRARAATHRDRVNQLIGPYVERRAAGTKHPVIDFLFTYYGHKPAQLRRWHPGYGVGLENAAEYAGSRGYRELPAESSGRPGAETITAGPDSGPAPRVWAADPAFLAKRRDTVDFIANLLRATATRPTHLSCFGLHEWAMVYRTDDVRHHQVPLRLGRTGTDAVVESMPLRCTHFDAYRFFTPDALPRNAAPLTRDDQLTREQPGCLHANMDLYKWAFKLVPLIDSTLLLDCFELSCTARELDMRASPYDLTDFGYTPVPIETPSGRAEYVRGQAELAEQAAPLRARLLAHCTNLLAPVVP
ncbi:3-methyladenine DNA glycosylase [Nocardia pseudobrasiliensis]|uniref:3-methyladenine DNA glycosylase n=1 Tax=Nocardia pseudobrasiliensis TaxID=45979 RepID=A0A370IAE2_9NOCA|nr:3-methyladenine DNA glycosylase [Nocardia pseudobrasiliensis]RDI67683.1 hypothetical protein DFR76_10280 [Nocardia pseudobrasiliensis]